MGILLSAAALMLSGCWGTSIEMHGCGDLAECQDFVMHEEISSRMIWLCTVGSGTGSARAKCVLDGVRKTCAETPPRGWFRIACVNATEHDHWPDMEAAITSRHRRCLGFSRIWSVFFPNGLLDRWGAWGADPDVGCP